MSSTVTLKPSVYWDGDAWVAELDYISWQEAKYFDHWEWALDHALWMGLYAGVWTN